MADPTITVYTRLGWLVAHVHGDDRMRTIMAADAPHLAPRVQSVLISEFGLLPPAAEALIASLGLQPLPTLAEMATVQAHLDTAVAAAADLSEQLAAAQADNDALREQVAQLEKKLGGGGGAVPAEPPVDVVPALAPAKKK